MSTVPRLPLLLAAALLLAACSRPAPAPEPVRAVRTLKVATGSVAAQLEYAAEIRARTESRLGFRVGGKLVRRAADVGQVVAAGQVLAELDPQDLRLAQEAARATVAAAQVSATQAKADYERFKDLQAQGFISAAELERRSSTWKAADAQLAQARAQADVQINQSGYSRLLAPAAGVVTAVDAEPGTVLATGASVLRLAHAGPRDVVFAVPEDNVDGLRALRGKPGLLTVKLWGRPEPLKATVREVAAAADPTTRTFLVKADLGEARVDLGQTASVSLPLPVLDGLVRLPLSALLQQNNRTVVWVLDPGTMVVKAQPVQVAGADANSALIASGLAAGAEVVTAGVHVLTEGLKVSRYAATAVAAASAPAPAPAK
ncbi:MAG: efflux RND transporter periplasmic adaptor subunit [Rubrivivax sp.]|nr:efflux RND transporter periplasmic adaptor subunit [Rubrivivax sp.]